ncbi:MAG: sialidase family protein [Actinomycetota bacterium]
MRTFGRVLAAFILMGLAALTLPSSGSASSEASDRAIALEQKRSVYRALTKEKDTDAMATTASFVPSSIDCRFDPPDKPNINLDCDSPIAPHNEPDIEVDPEDAANMIASSNDYESCCDGFYTTLDAGDSWIVGDMSIEDENRIGSDPVTVFDPVTDTAIHSSLNFVCRQVCGDGDLVVSLSTDDGVHWGEPVVVAGGIGKDDSAFQVFHDKEWIVTDTDPQSPFYGRTYLTWTAFVSRFGVYQESPILESHSDDGGRTWSEPQEISGFHPTCTFQETGRPRECDEDQFSVPTVAPDGSVYVAFENFQHEAAWEPGELFETQYMVVRSFDGGETWSAPVHVADLEDGTEDYPVNVDGRQTLTGFQARVNSAGNVTADPNTGRLYLVFSDNRNGRYDNPGRPVTNTDVFLSTSTDGVTWTRPKAVTLKETDQWFPWVDVDPTTGKIGVLYHDRRNFNLYDTTLAEGTPGALTFTRINTRPSHPRNSEFFQAGIPSCPECATFFGDYINIDYDRNGVAQMVWTDMRRFIETGYGENIFYASH